MKHIHLVTTCEKFSLCDLSGIIQVIRDTSMDRIQLPRTMLGSLSHEIVLSLSCSLLSPRASPSFFNKVSVPLACNHNSLQGGCEKIALNYFTKGCSNSVHKIPK